MTGYYKILPSRPSRYIRLRETIKKYYGVIEVRGEWLAVPFPQDSMFDGTVSIADPRARVWASITDPIDIKDLESALEKKKRGRKEWLEAI